MADRLDEIRARADAATPGPWHRPRSGQRDRLVLARLAVGRGHLALVGCRPSGERYAPEGDYARFGEANADFIANARSDVPFLLDRLAASEQKAARLRKALRFYAEIREYNPPGGSPADAAVPIMGDRGMRARRALGLPAWDGTLPEALGAVKEDQADATE